MISEGPFQNIIEIPSGVAFSGFISRATQVRGQPNLSICGGAEVSPFTSSNVLTCFLDGGSNNVGEVPTEVAEFRTTMRGDRGRQFVDLRDAAPLCETADIGVYVGGIANLGTPISDGHFKIERLGSIWRLTFIDYNDVSVSPFLERFMNPPNLVFFGTDLFTTAKILTPFAIQRPEDPPVGACGTGTGPAVTTTRVLIEWSEASPTPTFNSTELTGIQFTGENSGGELELSSSQLVCAGSTIQAVYRGPWDAFSTSTDYVFVTISSTAVNTTYQLTAVYYEPSGSIGWEAAYPLEMVSTTPILP